MRLSRAFLCAMFGIAMTIFSWYSPWAWPAWPALGTIAVFFGSHTSYADLPHVTKAAFAVLLIIINVAVWAGAAMLMWWLADQWRTVLRRPPPAV